MKKITKIPKNLQGILWSVDVKDLDINEDKSYIVNQILSLGLWKEFKWLLKTYPLDIVKKVFLEKPSKVYTFSSFNFYKNILFGLDNVGLPTNKYVKTLPRDIRS